MAREIKSVKDVSTSAVSQTEVTHPAAYAAVADANGDTVHLVSDLSELEIFVTIHQEPTGSSPTYDMKLQESYDGVNFVDINGAAISQLTGGSQSGTAVIRVPGPGTSDAKTFGPYVRVMVAIGGTTPVYTATLKLYGKE